VVQQCACHGFGSGADIQEHRGAVGYAVFGDLVQAAPGLIADIDVARGQDCAAMHPFEPARLGQVAEIVADCLDGDFKALREVVNGDLAFDSVNLSTKFEH
jgi:hypothetical protein